MRTRTPVTLLLTIALLAPATALAWGAKGDDEPSTALDRTDGWMWPTPDTSSTELQTKIRKVYFNTFFGQPLCYTPCVLRAQFPMLNPNLAQLQTAKHAYPYVVYGMLGVWKDCNKDGYVGLGDNALFEYRAELLMGDASVCKPSALPAVLPKQNWVPPHNDGSWVREFIPIGWDHGIAALDPNPFHLNDTGARMWADWGKPGEKPSTTRCSVSPQPRGTYHSVGNLVDYVDCFTTGRIDQTARAVPDAEPTWDALRALAPWGEEGDAAMVETWDCSAGYVVTQEIVVPGASSDDETRVWVNVSTPRVPPSGPNMGGSPAGTMNSTYGGLGKCDRDGGVAATAPYALEGDTINQVAERILTDQTLRYTNESEDQRPNPPQSLTGKGAPPEGGTALGATTYEGFWVGNSITAASRNPYVDRSSLTVTSVTYFTSYAYVSPGAITAYGLSLPKGASTGAYGAEACGGATTGIRNGWQCDPTKWWRDAYGEDQEPTAWVSMATTKVGARAGSLYNLRDVDCYDESAKPLRERDLSWGTLSGTACV